MISKVVLAVLSGAAVLCACGPVQNQPVENPAGATDSPAASPGTAEDPAGSPNDSVASPGASGGVEDPGGDASVASPGAAATDCAKEIALVCDAGFVDGCNGGLTKVHICVREGEKKSSPCTQEIARVCKDGLVDAYLLKPAAADNHICVKQP